jgi:hypothetical protein
MFGISMRSVVDVYPAMTPCCILGVKTTRGRGDDTCSGIHDDYLALEP